MAEKFILNKLKNELPKHLFYHTIHHVEDVFAAAINLAKQEGVTSDDLELLKLAVLFHDSGFIINGNEHEKTGCEIAKKTLPEFGYSPDKINKICGMIMATQIPQTPTTLLEQIICDADLDYLGRNDYSEISTSLFKEMNENSNLSERDWVNIQIKFLESHHYFTNTALNLRKQKKEEHLAALKINLSKLK